MSLEDKFYAAVKVIRGLPKSGSYQASNELMLRFYSYYKQATEGPCDKPKPGFWDVVNRAKWESWSRLGNMTEQEAMKAYVDELHKIVETMSYSSDVAVFLSGGDEDNGFGDQLALVAGDVLEKVRSRQNSPQDSCGGSGTSSPSRVPSPRPPPRAHHDSDDEFIDTLDSEPETLMRNVAAERETSRSATRLSNGHAHQITSQLTHLKVLEELPGTLNRLERDVAALRKAVEGDRRSIQELGGRWRWPWQELSPPTLALVLIWPFLMYKIISRRERTA